MPSIDTLHQLRDMLDRAMPTYLLIDPMLGEPPLPSCVSLDHANLQHARQTAWNRQIELIQLHPSIKLPAHQHPYLVELVGTEDPLLEFSVDVAMDEYLEARADGLAGNGGAAHQICGCVQGTQAPRQLAQDIAAMCKLNTEVLTPARYLRIIDRRTLGFLRYLVGTPRITAQFGAVQRWCYLDSFAIPRTLENTGARRETLTISRQEWAVLDNCEAVHRALFQSTGERPVGLLAQANTSEDRVYSTVLSALAQARKKVRQCPNRFLGLHDLTTWTAIAVQYPSFADSESIRELLCQASEAGDPAGRIGAIFPELKTAIEKQTVTSGVL